MIKEIIDKINRDNEVEINYFLKKFKMSHILFEYILKGMERKKYLKSIDCSRCELSRLNGKNRKYCKGYGKCWFLTSKGLKTSDKLKSNNSEL